MGKVLTVLLLIFTAGNLYSQKLTKTQKELLSRNVYSIKYTGDAIGGEKIIDVKVNKSGMTKIPNLPSVKVINGVMTTIRISRRDAIQLRIKN
jgi:uncharacterized membrane protein